MSDLREESKRELTALTDKFTVLQADGGSLRVNGSDVEIVTGRSLGELAVAANREHRLVLEAGLSMVEHAIQAGEALLEAKRQCEDGAWGKWLAENFDASDWTAKVYIKVAKHQRQVRENLDHPTLTEAISYVRGLPGSRDRRWYPEHLRGEAKRLVEEGLPLTEVAKQLGVSVSFVKDWSDPKYHHRRRAAHRNRQRAASDALAERRREQAIKRAVRKAGAATAEAWSMAERMQDVLAQAQRETEDREARRALSEAGVHYRKMRDEIVRALGVS